MKIDEINAERQVTRLLKLLSKEPRQGVIIKLCHGNALLTLAGRAYKFEEALIALATRKGHANIENGNLKITDAGHFHLKQKLNPNIDYATNHRELSPVDNTVHNKDAVTYKNHNESPLMRLFTRKTKNGRTYITTEEFQAGERLRKDFEKGQLQPKISANIQGSVGSGSSAFSSSVSDINDFAIDARKRVGLAMEKLGPELSGATVDICCFLKGLEVVERERQWPPRSAKLMLKTALSLLANHYGITGYENKRQHRFSSWTSNDYRPSIR